MTARFCEKAGALIKVTNGGRTAKRTNALQEFNNGVVLSAEPLKDNEIFEIIIEKKIQSWSGSVEIGVTTHDPDNLIFPSCATGFKDGTWLLSGCSILKDGSVIKQDYGEDLDVLNEGDTVGVLRKDDNSLHFYINGRPQGEAVTNIPQTIYVVVDLYGKCSQIRILDHSQHSERYQAECRNDAIQRSVRGDAQKILSFHEKTGILVLLTNGQRTAQRTRADDDFNNGVVMTNRPLKDDELFQIRIDGLVDKWSGSLEVGITSHNPNLLDFPNTMTNLRSGTIMMSGTGLLTNGKVTKRDFCNFSLDDLKLGDHVGLMRLGSGDLHYYINGVDQGVAAHLTPQAVWGVVDIYGRAVKVTIIDELPVPGAPGAPGAPVPEDQLVHERLDQASSAMETELHQLSQLVQRMGDEHRRLENLSTSAVRLRHPAEVQSESVELTAATAPAAEAAEVSEHLHPLVVTIPTEQCFSRVAGQHAKVLAAGMVARRHNYRDEFNNAVLISKLPIEPGEVFEIRVDELESKWEGSLAIGITTMDATEFTFPVTLSNSRSGTWLMAGSGVMHNGTTIIENYGPNLDNVKVNDHVGVLVTHDHKLHFTFNNTLLGIAAVGLPDRVFAAVDLYGQAVGVTVITGRRIFRAADSTNASVPRPVSPEFNLSSALTPTVTLALTPTVISGRFLFHSRHGKNAVITDSGRIATRDNARGEFNDAIVLSARSLQDEELFEIRVEKIIDRWSGSIEAGVTMIPPDELDFPSTLTDLDFGAWMLSGSAVMLDGVTVRNGYKLDLDSLTLGSRLGMMRRSNGNLHFFLNGVDQGVACSDVPPGVYAIIDLYGQCAQISITEDPQFQPPTDGSTTADRTPSSDILSPVNPMFGIELGLYFHTLTRNAVIKEEGLYAQRTSLGEHSIIFSAKPLQKTEIFEVEVDAVDSRYTGSMAIGLTCLNVSDLADERFPVLPPSVSGIKDKVTWVLQGSDLHRCGEVLQKNWISSIEKLTVGDRLGVQRAPDHSMHIFINGIDMGETVHNVPKNVYAVVDLFGPVTCVSLVKNVALLPPPKVLSRNESADSDNSFIEPVQTCCRTHGDISSDSEQEEPVVRPIEFLNVHGQNIILSSNNSTANRSKGFNHGVVFASNTLSKNMQFKVHLDQVHGDWTGSLMIGVTSQTPESSTPLPASALDLKSGTWVVQGYHVYRNGKQLYPHLGPNLDLLPAGFSVGLLLDKESDLHLTINDLDQGVVVKGLPGQCRPLVDLYGKCQQVALQQVPLTGGGAGDGLEVNKEKVNALLNEPNERLQRLLQVKAMRACPQQTRCLDFLAALGLPSAFYSPAYNSCYCTSCGKIRTGEKDSAAAAMSKIEGHSEARPPPVPLGWCKFGLKLHSKWSSAQVADKWHTAYKGIHPGIIRRILDTHDLTQDNPKLLLLHNSQPPSHEEKQTPEQTRGDTNKSVRLSPSLPYAGLASLTPRINFQDSVTRKIYRASVVLQVYIKPGSYKVEEQSLGLTEAVDPHYSNSEIEWTTKEKGGVIPVAALVLLE